VKRVATQLLDKGSVARGYLGLQMAASFEPADALKLGLDRAAGALVETVYTDTPAALAGLKTNDVILQVDTTPVSSLVTVAVALGIDAPVGSVTASLTSALSADCPSKRFGTKTAKANKLARKRHRRAIPFIPTAPCKRSFRSSMGKLQFKRRHCQEKFLDLEKYLLQS
jgi:serine protease Do